MKAHLWLAVLGTTLLLLTASGGAERVVAPWLSAFVASYPVICTLTAASCVFLSIVLFCFVRSWTGRRTVARLMIRLHRPLSSIARRTRLPQDVVKSLALGGSRDHVRRKVLPVTST